MIKLLKLFIMLILFINFYGCYILEEEEDPAIAEQKRIEEANKRAYLEHIKLLKSDKAIVIKDDDLEPRDLDIDGDIAALTTDGIHVIVLTLDGTIYQYNINDRSRKRLFNIKERTFFPGENLDLRVAYFLYYSQRVLTVGYYTNELLKDKSASEDNNDTNDTNNTNNYSKSIYHYRYRERKYLYKNGKLIEEVNSPIVKQNVAKYKERQYRLDRDSIFRESITDGEVGESYKEIMRKSIESNDYHNTHFVGLTIINDYAWVGSSSYPYLFKIKIKIKDNIDEMIDEYKRKASGIK